jgi:hypothetical protein
MQILKTCLRFAWRMLPVLSCPQQTLGGSALASRIDQVMQSRYSAGEFNRTVLIARRGEVLYAGIWSGESRMERCERFADKI